MALTSSVDMHPVKSSNAQQIGTSKSSSPMASAFSPTPSHSHFLLLSLSLVESIKENKGKNTILYQLYYF
jgi:hypothetical protein